MALGSTQSLYFILCKYLFVKGNSSLDSVRDLVWTFKKKKNKARTAWVFRVIYLYFVSCFCGNNSEPSFIYEHMIKKEQLCLFLIVLVLSLFLKQVVGLIIHKKILNIHQIVRQLLEVVICYCQRFISFWGFLIKMRNSTYIPA